MDDVIFRANYMENVDTRQWAAVDPNEVYIIPHGYCKKLPHTGKQFMLQSKIKSTIFLVDPATDNRIRLSGIDNGKIVFGPVGENMYEEFIYQVEIRLKLLINIIKSLRNLTHLSFYLAEQKF